MKTAIEGFLLACLLSLDGCAGVEPSQYVGFWDQCVDIEAYGLTMVTAYGPYTLGYLKWSRRHQAEGCGDVQ